MSFENATQWELGAILMNRLRSVTAQRPLCLHENDESLSIALEGICDWWLICAEHKNNVGTAFGMISGNSHWNLRANCGPFLYWNLFTDR